MDKLGLFIFCFVLFVDCSLLVKCLLGWILDEIILLENINIVVVFLVLVLMVLIVVVLGIVGWESVLVIIFFVFLWCWIVNIYFWRERIYCVNCWFGGFFKCINYWSVEWLVNIWNLEFNK